MYHFFVPEGPDEAGQIHITGSDVHHIRSVLRMKPGEQVVISDGRDKDYYCKITELNPGEITVQVLKETEAAELPARLILYQGLPKGEKMELIIQKAVEVQDDDTPEILQKRVMEQAEWNILPQAIDDIANGRIEIVNGIVKHR